MAGTSPAKGDGRADFPDENQTVGGPLSGEGAALL